MSNPLKRLSSRRVPPFRAVHMAALGLQQAAKVQMWDLMAKGHQSGHMDDFVKSYLAMNYDVLEEHVMDTLSISTLQSLQEKKIQHDKDSFMNAVCNEGKPPLQDRYTNEDIVKVQEQLHHDLYNKADHYPMLYELACVLGRATQCDSFSMYIPASGGNELLLYAASKQNKSGYELRPYGPVGAGTTVAAYAAHQKKTVLVKDIMGDDRFPKGTGVETNRRLSVLCAPVHLPSHDIICLMEFTRYWDCSLPFCKSDLQIITALISWCGTAILQAQINKSLEKQNQMNDFLLDVSKIIFDDLTAVDKLVKNIMGFTKDLVQADRCALFLVDKAKNELYADFMDCGEVDEDGHPVFTAQEKIRFSIESGIAGYVAKTGKHVNIADAYADERFNRMIDSKTGYTTQDILCMPIISKGEVLGVVQMVNKMVPGGFTYADENSFKMFAVYCALALHYAKVYHDMRLQKAKWRVAMEQVSYHLVCSEEEFRMLRNNPLPRQIPSDIDSFRFCDLADYGDQLPHLFIYMLQNLFGEDIYDLDCLCHFIMTVKKNYRPVAYHNWKHGWIVAHCIYCILLRIKDRGILSTLRMQAILIAALCHDVDHRGYSNKFFKEMDAPLAILYPQSVMEQHHYAQTVMILGQKEHDIFRSLNSSDYKMLLEYIRHAIIATDLMVYFENRNKANKLIISGTFDIQNEENLDLLVALMMTGGDLCGVCKPWPMQKNTIDYVYEEFYRQGDQEKQCGITPLPIMDRENQDHVPQDQVEFLGLVCLPCYEILAQLIPEVQVLADECRVNMEQWERIAQGKTPSLWEPQKSQVE